MGFEITDELVHASYLARYASVITYMKMYVNKVPMHTNVQQGMNGYNISYMGIKERKCHNVFRASHHVFGELCNTLNTQYGYEGSKGVRLEECGNYIGGTWSWHV